MLDYILLEKRNQYLRKIIQKTNNLTESIKLLSTIDKQLHIQSGGSFNTMIEQWAVAFEKPHKIGEEYNSKIEKLSAAITLLEHTGVKYKQLYEKMAGINPVFIKELDKMGETIDSLITRLTQTNTVFDEFELKQAIELFPNIKEFAIEYTELFKKYKTDQSKENKDKMLRAYEKLINHVQTLGDKPNYELFNTIINVLYPPLPWDEEKGDVFNDASETV
jgi:hypothetical protein